MEKTTFSFAFYEIQRAEATAPLRNRSFKPGILLNKKVKIKAAEFLPEFLEIDCPRAWDSF